MKRQRSAEKLERMKEIEAETNHDIAALSKSITEVCENVLRFAPIIMDKQQLNSVHGIDENIYIESLKRAVEFYFKFIKEYK